MKFLMNGCLLLATADGSTVEIIEEIGLDNLVSDNIYDVFVFLYTICGLKIRKVLKCGNQVTWAYFLSYFYLKDLLSVNLLGRCANLSSDGAFK